MKKFRIKVNNEIYEVEVEEIGNSAPAPPQAPAQAPLFSAVPPQLTASNKFSLTLGDAGTVTSPMPGMINDVKVKAGDLVKPGDILVILEAMKMENQIKADISGTVKEVKVTKGQAVNGGDPLVLIS
ncbi:MAG: biotin/lipoyl-binding protein [Desulfotomaculaceae bacterium]|nr:biotin/lipoyl-binding protein [Desulfotomaculaceae bacterium]